MNTREAVLISILVLGLSACCAPAEVTKTPSRTPAFTLTPAPSPASTATNTPVASPTPLLEHLTVGLAPSDASIPGFARCSSECPAPLVCESLASFSPQDGSFKPALAEDWRISPSTDEFTFELRDGVIRHDDVPLKAADVAGALEAALTGKSGPPPLYAHLIEGVEAVGERKVTVRAGEPSCAFFTMVAYQPLDFGSGRLPVGTGPFEAISSSEDGFELRKFRGYWGELPNLSGVSLRFFEDEGALVYAFLEGKLDVAVFPTGLPAGLQGEGQVLERLPAGEYFSLIFNLEDKTLADIRVRRALSLALDRERILSEVLGGEGVLIGSPFYPGYVPRSEAPIPPYDPGRARKLLAQVGWRDEDGDGFLEKDGQPLRVNVTTNGENPIRVQVAMQVASFYRAVGVESEVHIVEWGDLLGSLFKHDFQAAVFSWPLGPDPDVSLFFSSARIEEDEGFNFASYRNPRVDELLEEGLKVPGCDPSTRAEVYTQVARILAEERPYDFLFVPYTVVVGSGGSEGAWEALAEILR